MKFYITKISFLLLLSTMLFASCETEESLTITAPEAEFVLNTPGISTVLLNFALPDNPAFTLSWEDEVTGSSSYTVEMAADAEFTSPFTLGTTEAKNFSMTVAEFNNAIANSGATTFRDVPVYIRVSAGSEISNSILLLATRYPTDAPVISSPLAGDTFVLSIGSVDDTVLTVNWTDAVLESSLGTDINYIIEAATAGTDFASPVSIGTTTNASTVSSTHSELNAVAIGIGLTPEVAGDMDIRIVAKNTNSGGSELTRISDALTISVTPYLSAFPNLYVVGDATSPGWSNDNNNTPLFRNQDVPNNYVYVGYFGAGAFKLLETKGAWQPQWGTNDGAALAVNTGSGSDPGTFNVATAGYYSYNFTTVGESGSFTVEAYDASAAPTYTSMAIIGDATPNGWDGDNDTNFTQDTNNPHLWYINGVTLTSGGFILIRANDDWADVWRYSGSNQLYGKANLSGDGDNIPFNAETGSYDFWFNDLDGSYNIIPN
ncbi:SusE domain-containing protein [Algibacter lectus]|uniref:SusE domain-containing protein n=1 Tax=Algibacter lectus TaxID=221126 RepID=UPI0026EDE8BB|nr:SusE domain-containing protein [Algibacter lectus]MDO7137046.1 SusE domain-containing protein [Algibacter lectus]